MQLNCALNHAWYSFRIVCLLVDNEKLMESMKCDPVIHVRCSKDFKIAEKEKKWMERNKVCIVNRYILHHHKQDE